MHHVFGLFVLLSNSCEHDISRTPEGVSLNFVQMFRNFLPFKRITLRIPRKDHFKFGTNVHLDSLINWFNLGGQKLNVKVTVISQNMFLAFDKWYHKSASKYLFSNFDHLSLTSKDSLIKFQWSKVMIFTTDTKNSEMNVVVTLLNVLWT